MFWQIIQQIGAKVAVDQMEENKSSSLKKGPKDPPLSRHHWGRRLNRTFSGLYLNEKSTLRILGKHRW